MSSKKVFNIKDKVFAKIRGYPAWPAIISGVKSDTPSRQRYNVYFYGTGERGECKSEELFPYEENKSKLGKPNKRKYFAEALLQIEDDDDNPILLEDDSQVSVTPSNTSHIEQESLKDESENDNEVEKSNESNLKSEGKLTTDESTSSKSIKVVSSRKSLGLSISKGTKRKISDVKPEAPPKKSMSNKPKILESLNLKPRCRAIVLEEPLDHGVIEIAISGQQKLEQIADKNVSAVENVTETDKPSETLNTTESVLETSDGLLDSSKAVKSVSKIKNSPTSSREMSSTKSVNVGHVSRSGRKIKQKKYSDYENESEAPKRSILNKENSKNSEKHNTSNNETEDSSEQNFKTKDTNSETRKTSSKSTSSTIPHVNLTSTDNELEEINNEVTEESELPVVIKDIMVGSLSNIETSWVKAGPKKISKIDLLHTEVDLLDYIHKLRMALRSDRVDYELALEILDYIFELQINALMLKKHQEIVETMKKVTRYTGNAKEWNLNEEETNLHDEKSTIIRRKAEEVFNKFISLFAVSEGQTFEETFNKEVEEFFTKTKHLTCDQIYGITSDKDYN